MDKLTTIIVATIIVVLSAVALVLWSNTGDDDAASITSYEECVAAGYPIMESFPEQCAVPGGDSFTRELTDAEKEQNGLTDSETLPVDDAPRNVEEARLKAVGNYTGSGVATRSFEDGSFVHEVIAELDDPAPGKFYEGWLVTPGATDFFSTGELVSEGSGGWSLQYTSDMNYADYTEVVITEETLADGFDNVPEDHVLEGSF